MMPAKIDMRTVDRTRAAAAIEAAETVIQKLEDERTEIISKSTTNLTWLEQFAKYQATASKLAVLQQRLQKLYATTEQTEQVQETAKEIHQYSQISELTPEVMRTLVKRVII